MDVDEEARVTQGSVPRPDTTPDSAPRQVVPPDQNAAAKEPFLTTVQLWINAAFALMLFALVVIQSRRSGVSIIGAILLFGLLLLATRMGRWLYLTVSGRTRAFWAPTVFALVTGLMAVGVLGGFFGEPEEAQPAQSFFRPSGALTYAPLPSRQHEQIEAKFRRLIAAEESLEGYDVDFEIKRVLMDGRFTGVLGVFSLPGDVVKDPSFRDGFESGMEGRSAHPTREVFLGDQPAYQMSIRRAAAILTLIDEGAILLIITPDEATAEVLGVEILKTIEPPQDV